MKKQYFIYLLTVVFLLNAAGCNQNTAVPQITDKPASSQTEDLAKAPVAQQNAEMDEQSEAEPKLEVRVPEDKSANEESAADSDQPEMSTAEAPMSNAEKETTPLPQPEESVPQEQKPDTSAADTEGMPPDDEPVAQPEEPVTQTGYVQEVQVTETAPVEEAAVLQDAPAAVAATVNAVASGTQEKRNDKAVIDYSNTKDGYVMVQYMLSTSQKLKCRVTGPSTTYTYNLKAGEWATFSLSDGDGSYTVSVFENVVDTKYATVLTAAFEVKTQDEFAPFLLPNQYVDYKNAPNTVAKAKELTSGATEPLKKVEIVYDYVVTNLTYDKQLAQTVQSGYLPVLDTVLEKKTGICFDYAALMAGMLRSLGIPCKLVVGYAGEAYHAWINVWTEETGWVDGIIFFDGHAWKRMDPTFASSANASAEIMDYIGNGANYTAKYVY